MIFVSRRPVGGARPAVLRSVLTAAAAVAMAVPAGPADATASRPAPHPGSHPETGGTTAGQPGDALFETFAPDGSITLRRGGPDYPPRPLPTPPHQPRAGTAPQAVAMHLNGDPAKRINLVFVGDGYTAAQLPDFDKAAENAWQALVGLEPYKSYQQFFNAYRVDVASPVSGISNDPTNGVTKSTPLGMYFYCHQIDRLLCVNTTAAQTYANVVPGQTHVVAIANTTTYGGAGGSITTLAGGNPSAALIIQHEMAHTLADLADEYDTPYATATNPEADPAQVNVTTETQAQMQADGHGWARWLGTASPDGSTVGAYAGANYYQSGFYRPSSNSIMRTLGQPFNPPSAEALIKAFYAAEAGSFTINPIDTATPAPTATGLADRTQTLSIATVPLTGSSYQIYWAVNGTLVAGSTGATSLKPSSVPLKAGQWNSVTVYVRDLNPMVKDQAFMTANMNKSVNWWVWGG